jgi:hypothetical protein
MMHGLPLSLPAFDLVTAPPPLHHRLMVPIAG